MTHSLKDLCAGNATLTRTFELTPQRARALAFETSWRNLVARYALGHERGSADMLVDRILDRLIESEKAYGRPCFGDHLRRVKGRLL